MSQSFGSSRKSASRESSSGPASNYGATAADLGRRGIDAVNTPYIAHFHGSGGDRDNDEEGPRAVRSFTRELLRVNSHSTALNEETVRTSCDVLLRVLSGEYAKETDFNKGLFDAMAECLTQLVPSVDAKKVDETKIILTKLTGTAIEAAEGGEYEYEYATGLAREAKLRPDNGLVLTFDAWTDHAWVIYRRRTGCVGGPQKWEVWRALAVVDFKRGYKKWDIQRTNGEGGEVDAKSLELSQDKNGPIAQAIMYSVAHAAPGIASLGELPRSIPFALIQCMTDKSKVDVGWVHANLVTPDACGELFSFNVDAYGSVYPEEASNGPPLAAYLDVMSNGLQVAKRWLRKLQQRPRSALPAPHQLSGRNVQFGARSDDSDLTSVVENPTLLATPVLKYCAEGSGFYRVHQGELFRATVDLNLFRSNLSSRDRVYWCPDAYPNHSTNSRAVLIKVTSKACFNLLIPRHSALLYDVDLWWEATVDVRMALSGSLYGFYHTADSCGLLQLLPDLRSLGYGAFPSGGSPTNSFDWGALWTAFAGLVQKVLIPLARAGIIHADIRTGHDVTSNLLYNEDSRSMRLIDLDSLCTFKALLALREVSDRRYLSAKRLPEPLKSARAVGYVLGQVLCAGEVWLGRIRHDDVDADDMVRRALPRRRPAAAGGAGGGNLVNDAGGTTGSDGGVFSGCAFDDEGNFTAVVNEDLIKAALVGYQAKFESGPSLVVRA